MQKGITAMAKRYTQLTNIALFVLLGLLPQCSAEPPREYTTYHRPIGDSLSGDGVSGDHSNGDRVHAGDNVSGDHSTGDMAHAGDNNSGDHSTGDFAQGGDPRIGDAIHIIGFGDSVTDGFCATSGLSFFELLIQNNNGIYPQWRGRDLRSHFASVTSNNQAISGSASCDYSTSDITYVLQQDPHTWKPTVVVITLGGNDLIHNYNCSSPGECHAFCSSLAAATSWADNYRQRMIGFIQAAKASITGPTYILLANIYDPTDGVGDIENAGVGLPPWPDGFDVLALYNQQIEQIALATGAVLVDMRAAMLGHGIHFDDRSNPYYDAGDPTYWYCQNLEDPNDRGYHAIRAAFWQAIEETLRL
ncbi:MAG: hypothetical protein A2289_18685 [Deltaproteobacteria bacterium RIFOXYA12_FULL_58_15]|nr:MAG: hypothetical protein A2289_18685 [Deltaproteobacteria bacterium RIFOXYA12_FULL_58_15]OGR14135.1 MAG: hypothetical protein A2341_15770 [Deltaproteobacteria bacterium RIFOXYB12_FULL_58_9]